MFCLYILHQYNKYESAGQAIELTAVSPAANGSTYGKQQASQTLSQFGLNSFVAVCSVTALTAS